MQVDTLVHAGLHNVMFSCGTVYMRIGPRRYLLVKDILPESFVDETVSDGLESR